MTSIVGRRILSASFAALMLVSSCQFSNIDVIEDRRVKIMSPKDWATVTMPVTIRWEGSDVEGLRYAVFVDRPPMKPGAPLRELAKDDDVCLARPDCPDKAWLENHNVYLPETESLTVPFLPDGRPLNRPEARDLHEVLIVLLDGDTREGEAAFRSRFYVDRSDS